MGNIRKIKLFVVYVSTNIQVLAVYSLVVQYMIPQLIKEGTITKTKTNSCVMRSGFLLKKNLEYRKNGDREELKL